MTESNDNAVAVIGIACRFPMAPDANRLWRNLCEGVEAIRFFSDQELLAAGVAPAALADPGYVKAAPVLDGIEDFDAAFFGFTPREAEILDPQQRLLLECAYHALEDAGRARVDRLGDVGVYVGVSSSSYLHSNLATRPDILESMGLMALSIANDKDFVAAQIAYRLDLTGPAVNIATACSTSLVAIHAAYNAVLNFECDLALAGGASVKARQVEGYVHQDGGVLSPDGRCRPFSAAAKGTVGGSGAAVVVLKRLADALADGDAIYAVITGSAANNDGAEKLGFTAPSATGQARVIREAMALANVSAADIGYVEAHGTATPLGDPVEIAALRDAHGSATRARCAIGSIKSNFGHLDAAAGVAGFIKAALAVRRGEIPPSLHYDAPNPQIDFAKTRFFVADRLQSWPDTNAPRRAAVSSFGIGGTNAHVILEQAPAHRSAPTARNEHLMVLSAKDRAALDAGCDPMSAALAGLSDAELADASFTLYDGRPVYAHRAALVAGAGCETGPWVRGHADADRKVAWLFAGQGSQHVDMARGLYEHEPVFRQTCDTCARWIRAHAGWDLIALLYPANDDQREQSRARLGQTRYTQLALFVIEYGLAQLWLSLGARPDLMLGHSLGEYAAACVAGVIGLEDALLLLETRGRLIGDLPPGAMISVALGSEHVRPLLLPGVDLAADNAPSTCVLGGAPDAIAAMQKKLADADVKTIRLDISHAFHTGTLDPILGAFRRVVETVKFRPPTMRYISCTSARIVEASEVCDPEYWIRHLREAVDFRAAMRTLAAQPGAWRFVDIGPGGGGSIGTLARHNGVDPRLIARSLPHERDEPGARRVWLKAVAQVWADGVDLELDRLHHGEQRRRVHLPGYAFNRAHHWIAPGDPHEHPAHAPSVSGSRPLYRHAWQQRHVARAADASACRRLVFADAAGRLERALADRSDSTILVHAGSGFARTESGHYRVRPAERADFDRVLDDLAARGFEIEQVLFGWALDAHDLIELQGALATLSAACKRAHPGAPMKLVVLTSSAFQIGGADAVEPAQRALAAMVTVLAQEEPDWTCRVIDVAAPVDPTGLRRALNDADERDGPRVAALRGSSRWLPAFERIGHVARGNDPYASQVVVILGGLGAIGSELALLLAPRAKRVVVVGRRAETAFDAGAAARLRRLRAATPAIEYRAADVGDADALRALLLSIRDSAGPIGLLIHAAAAIDAQGLTALADSGAATFERHNRAKVAGTLALADAARDACVERVVLMSSLSATLGGLGLGPYASANAYMDALVESPWRLPGEWYGVGWDGLATAADRDRAEEVFFPEEVLDIIGELVAEHPPGLYLASRRDLNRRWRQWGQAPAKPAPKRAAIERDPSRGEYTPPANEAERIVAAAFEALIGLHPIDARDDFFALGGDSLLATQLCSRLRQQCKVDLPIAAVFDKPVVADLAAHVIYLQGAAAIGDDEIRALVNDLEDLDECALRELLAE